MASSGLTQLKYKGNTYNIGDCLMLRESNLKILVCRLLEIMQDGGIPGYEEWPSIKVQWYYHWSELDLEALGVKKEDHKFLGDNELFFSDHVETVYIDSILGKCDVNSLQEYDNLENMQDEYYFSRTKLITRENRIEPSFERWETFCICNKPMNPNLLTVGCDK